MGILTSVGLLGIVLLSMVACNEAGGTELLASPHFPQQRENMDVMDADLEGELALEEGCLRTKSKGGTDYLLIWPHGFKLSVDGPDIRIGDDSGVSLSVGEEIRIGGGEVPLAHVQTLVEQPVPDECPGPYWVVGEVPIPTGAQESSGPVAQIQQQPTPTSTPSPKLPRSITPVPASEKYRLDLGGDVVVAFVEGLSPEHSGKVAYVTHVPSGSQLVLDRDGRTVDRHDGRGDGPSRLDAAVSDPLAMERIMERLQNDEDARPREMVAFWVHSVQFGDITYIARWMVVGPETISKENDLTEEDLGPELYRVAFRIDGYGGSFQQDGDATYLNPGTPVYVLKGYSQEFRLATLEDGEVTLFEADTNPEARIGEDLLDIRGKVTAIDILSTKNSIEVLGTKTEDREELVLGKIEEERTIERFVASVLESPVDQGRRDHEGPRYSLYFRLADGTSVVRAFWLESGELWRGVMTDPTVTLSVWRALGDEHRPAATDGGPRISERLAARLGLAYLGFSMPGVVVTGKPHSPVVRLMRWSEFDAMRGSSSATKDPDQLVWVVEAQGSWRDAGIVPEDKRRDFAVGQVAFDADTGRRYGSSHVNTSLLGTPGGFRPSTPTPTPTPAPEPSKVQSRANGPTPTPVRGQARTPGPRRPTATPTYIKVIDLAPHLADEDKVNVVVETSSGERHRYLIDPEASPRSLLGEGDRLVKVVPPKSLMGNYPPPPTSKPPPLPVATPTPAGVPIDGQSEPVLDSRGREEQRRREIMAEFPERMKTWIDEDTIVYLLIRDPHDREGELIAVAQDMPTGTVKNYELAVDSDGQPGIVLYSEKTPDSSEGRAASLRLEQDARIAEAALHLLTTVKRWSKN